MIEALCQFGAVDVCAWKMITKVKFLIVGYLIEIFGKNDNVLLMENFICIDEI